MIGASVPVPIVVPVRVPGKQLIFHEGNAGTLASRARVRDLAERE